MDGWRKIPEILRNKNSTATNDRYYDEDLKGWHCWAYPDKDTDLQKWMEENMVGSFSCDFKFNSGDPMYLVFIKEDQDATLFKLTWNPTPDRFSGAGAW